MKGSRIASSLRSVLQAWLSPAIILGIMFADAAALGIVILRLVGFHCRATSTCRALTVLLVYSIELQPALSWEQQLFLYICSAVVPFFPPQGQSTSTPRKSGLGLGFESFGLGASVCGLGG